MAEVGWGVSYHSNLFFKHIPPRRGPAPCIHSHSFIHSPQLQHFMQTQTQTQIEDALRADKAQQRSDKLIRVCAEFGLTLPKNAMEWRVPTEPARGKLPSFNCEAELLCTDGIVAWFAVNGKPFFGHLAAFDANKKESEAKSKSKPSKAKAFEELLAML